jgi:dihydropteroate synthase
MGILNVTPDSFSDGGLCLDPARAEERALRLEAEGADLLDVGGESSRPGAVPVPAEEECARVLPVLRRILPKLRIPVTIDTSKPEVMERALGLGVSGVNDIAAMRRDPRIPRLLAEHGAGVVLMHMRGEPRTMQDDVRYGDLEGEVEAYLRSAAEAALAAGVAPESVAVDPGIGFGKSPEGNCELLGAVGRLKERLGFPVCVGLSRKSFLRRIFGEGADLRAANAAAHALAAAAGADILRAHDVAETRRVAELAASVRGRGGGG